MCYHCFILLMDRSSGFGSTLCNLSPFSDSLSLRLRNLSCLTSLHHVTRRPILQKVRGRTRTSPFVLPLLVNIRFQILFHSPPGVLFTFPSRYYTLSVTRSYLALGDGPPSFTPDFTCPVLLWITLAFTLVSDTGLLPCFAWLSNQLLLPSFLALMGS